MILYNLQKSQFIKDSRGTEAFFNNSLKELNKIKTISITEVKVGFVNPVLDLSSKK